MTQAFIDAILAGVNFDIIVGGIAGVAAVLVLPKVAVKGARMVLGMIR